MFCQQPHKLWDCFNEEMISLKMIMVSSGAETSAGLWLGLNLHHRIGHKGQILSFQFVMTGELWEPQLSPQAKQASLVVLSQNSQISCSHSFIFFQRLSASYKLYVLGLP